MPDRNDVFRYVLEKYGTEPEYLWLKLPGSAVLRHSVNRKWYGIVMDVSRARLGLDGNDIVDVLNLKCDPLLIGSLLKNDGFLPAYHMNKTNWISLLLNGTLPPDEVFSLIDLSYDMTLK